jgi:demethylmenaquinone methyltransferase/2-methoxy-6-polyprenyl-1,4-benzoquinol methylase
MESQVSRADLGKDPAQVAAMFDGVAKRYDLTNDVLSVGQTSRWRRAVNDALALSPGEIVLDLAAGTMTSTQPFLATGARAVACDFSLGMLAQGARRYPETLAVAGDGMNLPFADESFDAVTISFGLRNIVDPKVGLAEMYRVTKPGGRLGICEFSTPVHPVLRTAYLEYLMKALPSISQRVASNPEAYRYLAESIRAWPDQIELAKVIAASGWDGVQYRNLNAGIVALHRAFKYVE